MIIKNVDVLQGKNVDKNSFIEIAGNRIKRIGAMADMPDNHDAYIDGKSMFAMPGLVNTHNHSSMTLLRDVGCDLAFTDWLFGKIIPIENNLEHDDIYWGTMLAQAEMISTGTTTFHDMYLYMRKVAEAVSETGMRACISRDIIKGSDRLSEREIHPERFLSFYKEWNGAHDGRIKINMELHSVYLYTEKILQGAAEIAKQHNVPIHMHLLEAENERGNCIETYGKDPVSVCVDAGIFDVPVVAAHCVYIDEKDRAVLSEKKVSVSHCPTSNLKLGNGIADIVSMQRAGINVTIGTDGCASNNNLNMLEEMHLAALLNKGLHKQSDLVKADEVLDMATVNGAQALGFDHVGILEEGMKADIILVDMDKPHLVPAENPITSMVYSAQGSDVDTVIVDGKILMRHRELQTIDLEKAKYEVKARRERLLKSV